MATTVAALTEVFYLLRTHAKNIEAAWRLLHSGSVTVFPNTDADLTSLERLMKQYDDRPMDFADATLVHLAKRESLSTIFTIGHDDFEAYRIDGRRKFHIVPSR